MRPPHFAILATTLAIFAVALAIDPIVATRVHDWGGEVALKSDYRWLARLARLPGNILTYTLPVAILFLILSLRYGFQWVRYASFIFVAGLLSGSNGLIKWIIGRARPFQGEVYQIHPFVGGIHGLFGPNQSFPSGDVSLAAATSFALMRLFPRQRILWLSLILIVAAERIAENAHYPSDTVAATALGWAVAQIASRLTGRPARADVVPDAAPADIYK